MRTLEVQEMTAIESGNGPVCGATMLVLMGLFAAACVATAGAATIATAAMVTFGVQMGVC